MKLDYNDITIRTVSLGDLWDDNLRCALWRRMCTRKSILYVAEFRGAVLGFCYGEYARLFDTYILLPHVGENFRAQVLNAVRYVLFEKTDCSAIEFKLDGNERDRIYQSLEGACVLKDQGSFYRVQIQRRSDRVLV